MAEKELDFALFGDILIKPSTGETADPVDVLVNKVVRASFVVSQAHPMHILQLPNFYYYALFQILLYFGAQWHPGE